MCQKRRERGHFAPRLSRRRRHQEPRSPRVCTMEEQRAHQPDAGVNDWGHEHLGHHVNVRGVRLPQAGFAGVPRKPHRPAYNVQPPSAAARAATVAIVEVEDPVAQASEKCHDVCIHRVRQNEQIRPGRLRLVTTEAHADEHAGQLERLQRCIDLVGMILCQLPNCVAHDFPEPLCQVFIKALGRERHDQPIDYFEAGLALLLLQERVAA
mmetsp:Transcript_769/g.2366  ORF Transcript_769/g.2366 Transcript_769/m.2366 type:complete len:210 (+) Transcript_769:1547-2176(+)